MNKYVIMRSPVKGACYMTSDSIPIKDRIFFKHEISENPPGDTYSMHAHNMYELLYFVEGDATQVIEDRKYKLKKGDLVVIRPFQYHFIRIDSPKKYERYNILFDPVKHLVDGAEQIQNDAEVIKLAENGIAEELFRRCKLYYENSDTETFEKILPHLLSELFYNIILFPGSPAVKTKTLSPLISKALKYINDNLCTITDMGEIAEKLFVSQSYFFRLFQKELHQTPKKYIMEKRLLLADKMISSGEKAVSVSKQCGFGDYTTFYRNYAAFFGVSPSEKNKRDNKNGDRRK